MAHDHSLLACTVPKAAHLHTANDVICSVHNVQFNTICNILLVENNKIPSDCLEILLCFPYFGKIITLGRNYKQNCKHFNQTTTGQTVLATATLVADGQTGQTLLLCSSCSPLERLREALEALCRCQPENM